MAGRSVGVAVTVEDGPGVAVQVAVELGPGVTVAVGVPVAAATLGTEEGLSDKVRVVMNRVGSDFLEGDISDMIDALMASDMEQRLKDANIA